MKKHSIILLFMLLFAVSLTGCKKKENSKVTIWTSTEDYRIEYYLSALKEKFPDYEIILEYMGSSEIAAKVREEGENSTCDIILSEEYGYLDMIEDELAELKDFDFSPLLDDIVPASHKYTPDVKNGGCVILNNAVLSEKGLNAPESYQDLLDPSFKDLISMPNPASSGTGYMFLRQLTNEWGEDEAFAYFDQLTENILQYTSSGSGPINALIQGEAAVGLGMTSQAVIEINEGVDLSIKFFPEGSPFSMYGSAVLLKSAERQAVMDVFNYLAIDLAKETNQRYFPDQIFKDFVPVVEGYPTDIPYGNMENDTRSEKERLLEKWTY